MATYTRTTWVDNTSPFINAANLNNIETGMVAALRTENNLSDVGAIATARTNLDAASRKQGGAEVAVTNASVTGAVTIDASTGSVFDLTLTGNMTGLTISNPPASGLASTITVILRQDATGSRTATFSSTYKWAGASAPTLSTAASSVDIISFLTKDGGTTWYGFLGGKAFA